MNYILYSFIIFLCIFQTNYKLETILGQLGSTYIPFIVPIALVFIIYKYRKIIINKPTQILIKLSIYSWVLNIVIIIIYLFVINGDLIILQENMFIKAFKGNVYLPIVILLLITIEGLVQNLSVEKILRPFFLSFNFLFCALIFEKFFNETFTNIFHNGEYYNRIRLFTSESSFTASIIIVYGILSLYYVLNYKKKYTFLTLMFLSLFFVLSGSKGLLGIVVISTIIIIMFSHSFKLKYKMLLVLATVILFIFLSGPIIQSLLNDIENYTSVATRSYSIIISLLMLFLYPLGTGNVLYLLLYPAQLKKYIYIITQMGLNPTEINSYIYATTDKSIGVKSGILQYSMLWGIPGFCYLFKYFISIRKYLNRIRNEYAFLLTFGYVFCLMAALFLNTLDVKYEIWIYMNIIFIISQHNSNEINKI